MSILQTFTYAFMCLCKVDHATDKFIHILTFNYDEVMPLLELTCVVEQA